MLQKRLFISMLLISTLFASPVLAGGITATVNAVGTFQFHVNIQAVHVTDVMPNSAPYCQHGNLICYSPDQIRKAYNFPANLDGSGQTIVIIDAFGSPSVTSDLAQFDSIFGLPPADFTVECPAAGCPVVDLSNNNQVGWTSEIALDTQWAHAIAPGAKIVLEVGATDSNTDLNAAIQKAINKYPGSIISQSFGSPEGTFDLSQGSADRAYLAAAEALYRQAAAKGDTVFASAGDWGADFSAIVPSLNFANAGYPASSPWVTGVGGTQGNPYYFQQHPASCNTTQCSAGLVLVDNSTGTCTRYTSSLHFPLCTPTGYGGEQVWNEPWAAAATGGAPSLVFKTPSYQSGLGLSSRTTPDVSYDAAISGGVLGVWGVGGGCCFVFGGTSAGSPQWAGIAALAGQANQRAGNGPLGFINPALYQIGHNAKAYARDFHDITVGNNLVAGGTVGFSATKGYDDASGWGTPNVANLIPDLLNALQNSQVNNNP